MFLVSLAIADLLVAIFVMPFAIVNDMQVWNKSARFFHFSQSFPLHNVLFVQYIYLATEQAQTYRKSCSLIYLLTYICPSAFDCEVNAIFRIFVKSNSKSGRFSSFLMPNNLGTGQKKAYFLGALEN